MHEIQFRKECKETLRKNIQESLGTFNVEDVANKTPKIKLNAVDNKRICPFKREIYDQALDRAERTKLKREEGFYGKGKR